MNASDRVVVMREGAVVAERDTTKTSKSELAELMVGRQVSRPVRTPSQPGGLILEACDVSVTGKLSKVTFKVHAGEILGIVGVAGNGQSALGELLCGVLHATGGTLRLSGASFPQGDVQADSSSARPVALILISCWQTLMYEAVALSTVRACCQVAIFKN